MHVSMFGVQAHLPSKSYLCMIRDQNTSRALFCCFPPYSIETESITGLSASLVSKIQCSSCLNPTVLAF